MPPRPQQRLLHYVLRALPISVGELDYIAEQRAGVLGVQRAQQLVARHTHILHTLAGGRRFIAIIVAPVWTPWRPGHMADPRHGLPRLPWPGLAVTRPIHFCPRCRPGARPRWRAEIRAKSHLGCVGSGHRARADHARVGPRWDLRTCRRPRTSSGAS